MWRSEDSFLESVLYDHLYESLGTELRSPDFAASTVTCRAISLTLFIIVSIYSFISAIDKSLIIWCEDEIIFDFTPLACVLGGLLSDFELFLAV